MESVHLGCRSVCGIGEGRCDPFPTLPTYEVVVTHRPIGMWDGGVGGVLDGDPEQPKRQQLLSEHQSWVIQHTECAKSPWKDKTELSPVEKPSDAGEADMEGSSSSSDGRTWVVA